MSGRFVSGSHAGAHPAPAFTGNFPTISRLWAAHLPDFFPSVLCGEKCDKDHSHHAGPGTSISASCFTAHFVGDGFVIKDEPSPAQPYSFCCKF